MNEEKTETMYVVWEIDPNKSRSIMKDFYFHEEQAEYIKNQLEKDFPQKQFMITNRKVETDDKWFKQGKRLERFYIISEIKFDPPEFVMRDGSFNRKEAREMKKRLEEDFPDSSFYMSDGTFVYNRFKRIKTDTEMALEKIINKMEDEKVVAKVLRLEFIDHNTIHLTLQWLCSEEIEEVVLKSLEDYIYPEVKEGDIVLQVEQRLFRRYFVPIIRI